MISSVWNSLLAPPNHLSLGYELMARLCRINKFMNFSPFLIFAEFVFDVFLPKKPNYALCFRCSNFSPSHGWKRIFGIDSANALVFHTIIIIILMTMNYRFCSPGKFGSYFFEELVTSFQNELFRFIHFEFIWHEPHDRPSFSSSVPNGVLTDLQILYFIYLLGKQFRGSWE